MDYQICDRIYRRRENGKNSGNQDNDDCPRCGQPEDTPHVIRCQGKETEITFEIAIQKLEVHLCDTFTAPEIKHALDTRIRQWRQKSSLEVIDQATQLPAYSRTDAFGTQQAVEAQDKIGWYNLLLGRMAQEWTDAEQQYLESLGKKTTGKRWTISIIKKLWDIAWDMWAQRNHINHNTLHPMKQQEMEELRAYVAAVYSQGNGELLPRDRTLFQKSLATIQKGTAKEQEQWLLSVTLAQRRAEAVNEERREYLYAERQLLESWLGITHATDTPELQE
jgi:hypothetical protein